MEVGYRALFDRKTNQNLVPEQTNEAETRASEKSMFKNRFSLVLNAKDLLKIVQHLRVDFARRKAEDLKSLGRMPVEKLIEEQN